MSSHKCGLISSKKNATILELALVTYFCKNLLPFYVNANLWTFPLMISSFCYGF